MRRQIKSGPVSPKRAVALAGIAIFVVAVVLYAQAATFTFSNYDDNDYVTENVMVQRGVGWDTVVWAFTTGYATHWHPLTWLSHALDVKLYGMHPGGHHFSSVFLHALNAVILFLALRRLTGELGLSLCVAVLFSVHPMNVQSVAWIAERKNVLSTFFGFLCLYQYALYAERRSLGRYMGVILWLMLGLMSKAMLVTWPFLLLLLDWWPLRRIEAPLLAPGKLLRAGIKPALEKLPLLAMVAATSVAAYLAMRTYGAVAEGESYPLGVRVENAVVSYVAYLVKLFAPFGLAPFYPHPLGALPTWKVGVCVLLLVGITASALRFSARAPYFALGWFWYLGTLVPVIGIVQVGEQAMGDRYAYVPYIGLFVAGVWSTRAIAERFKMGTKALVGVFSVVVLLLAGRTFNESRNWRDDVSLWGHAVAVTEKNYIAHQNLGVALRKTGRNDEALEQFKIALNIRPNHTRSLINVGTLLLDEKKVAEALPYLESAVQSKESDPMAQVSLGMGYARAGQMEKAIAHMKIGFDLNRRDYRVANLLGTLYAQHGDFDAAAESFRAALAIKSDYALAQTNLQKLAKQKNSKPQ